MRWTEKELHTDLLKRFKEVTKIDTKSDKSNVFFTNKKFKEFQLKLIYEERTYEFILHIPVHMFEIRCQMFIYDEIVLTTEKNRIIGRYINYQNQINTEVVYNLAIEDIQKRLDKKRRNKGEDIKYNIICLIQEELLKNGYKTQKFKNGKNDVLLYKSIIGRIFIFIENSDVIVRLGNCRISKSDVGNYKICSLDDPRTDIYQTIVKILYNADTLIKRAIT